MGQGVLLRGFALIGFPRERGGKVAGQMLVPGTVRAVQALRMVEGWFWDDAV